MRGLFFMRNTLKIIFVVIGAVIGAGFASGKEIYLFFNVYGIKGLWGIAIASVLTGMIIYKAFKHLKDETITDYSTYLSKIGLHARVGDIMAKIVNIFLLLSFYIMIAGFCAYFEQEFHVPYFITGIIVATLCYITLMGNIEGVTKANTILVPFLIMMIIFIGIKNGIFNFQEIKSMSNDIASQLTGQKNWLISSIEYASYNTILLIPMLISMKKYAKGHEKIVGITIGSSFFILATILYVVLLSGGIGVHSVELPLIHIVNHFGSFYPIIYGLVIVSAIYTTAIASGYSFIQNSSKTQKGYQLWCMALCISSILIAKLGFAYLVNTLYPLFGLLGLLQVFFILRKR